MICQPRQSPAPPRAGLSLSLRIRKSTPPAVPGRRGTYSVIRPTNCHLRGTHNPFPGILPCRILTAKLHILAPILVIQIDRHVQIVDVVHIPYGLRCNETAAAVLAGRILTHRPAYRHLLDCAVLFQRQRVSSARSAARCQHQRAVYHLAVFQQHRLYMDALIGRSVVVPLPILIGLIIPFLVLIHGHRLVYVRHLFQRSLSSRRLLSVNAGVSVPQERHGLVQHLREF